VVVCRIPSGSSRVLFPCLDSRPRAHREEYTVWNGGSHQGRMIDDAVKRSWCCDDGLKLDFNSRTSLGNRVTRLPDYALTTVSPASYWSAPHSGHALPANRCPSEHQNPSPSLKRDYVHNRCLSVFGCSAMHGVWKMLENWTRNAKPLLPKMFSQLSGPLYYSGAALSIVSMQHLNPGASALTSRAID